MATIKITWSAFGGSESATFEWDGMLEGILEKAFRDTNQYSGVFWDALEPHLPEDRTHTALSIGDTIEVDGRVFRCDLLGWTSVTGEPV